MTHEKLKKLHEVQGIIRKKILPVIDELLKDEEADLEKIGRKELKKLEYTCEKRDSVMLLNEAVNLLFKVDSYLCAARGEDEKVADVIREFDVPKKNVECYTNTYSGDSDFSPLNRGEYVYLSLAEQDIIPIFNYKLMGKEEYQEFNHECGDDEECKYSFADAYGDDSAKVLVILLEKR